MKKKEKKLKGKILNYNISKKKNARKEKKVSIFYSNYCI
jgi:hypothetical protein